MKYKSLKYKHISVLFLLVQISVFLYGQDPINNPFQIPEFVPKSPEVASFQRYGEIPVSLYTGVPNISVPIHNVALKDLQVPINLSYHAGGITVNQEATFVGLGWTLFAGGTITLVPAGNRDLNIFTLSNWEETLAYYASLNPSDIISTADEGPGHSYGCGPVSEPLTDLLVISNAAMGYGEQDIYNVSLPNKSFKFIIHPKTGKPFFVGEKNNCQIEIYSQHYFKIIDENGVTYLFEEYEEDGQHGLPNCWYLTSITDVNGNIIELEYDTFGGYLEQNSGFHEVLKFGYPSSTNPIRFEGAGSTSVNNLYLTSIRSVHEEVIFSYTHNREDIYGDGAMRLDSIVVNNITTNNKIKKFRFNYDYFYASNVGGNNATDTDEVPSEPTDYLKKRLKLERVLIVNPTDETDFQSYDFNYHEDYLLPLKTTFAKDFWGYYNGQENASQLYTDIRHTLIPNPRVLAYMQSDYVDFVNTHQEFQFDECANRFSHPEYIKTATIKSIKYPTGGRTDFEFETHDFYNEGLISAQDNSSFFKITSAIAGVHDMNDGSGTYSHVSQSFIVDVSKTVRLKGQINPNLFPGYDLSSSTIRIISTSGGSSYVYDFQNENSIEVELDLAPGNYMLTCSAPENVPFNYNSIVSADLFNNYFDEDAINEALNKTSIGGGLRIKKVVNYDTNDEFISAKEYIYQKENGTTSGKLIKYPFNYKEERLFQTLGQGVFRNLTIKSLLSDNILPIYNSSSSPNVAYDRVMVKQTSADNSIHSGYEIYYYTNKLPMLGFDFNFYNTCTNGDVEKKIILNASDDTLKVEVYHYDLVSYEKAMVNITAKDRFYGSTSECLYDYFSNGGRYDVAVYGSTNFVNQVINIESYDYNNNGIVNTYTEHIYDENTYQIRETSTHTDKGIRKTIYQYPFDDPDYLSHSVMLGKNWISPVVEQKDYLDDDLLKTTENHYWFYHDYAMVALHDVNIGFGNEIPETKVIFENYDLSGNVLELHKPNDASLSYIWSYKDQYPVIKAINIDQSTLESAVTSVLQTYFSSQTLQAFMTSLSDMTDASDKSTWKTFNEKLREDATLNGAMITTYTYNPLIGMTSQTDANGITTYYEYDDFGRLESIKDQDGNIVQFNEYNYQTSNP